MWKSEGGSDGQRNVRYIVEHHLSKSSMEPEQDIGVASRHKKELISVWVAGVKTWCGMAKWGGGKS